VGVQCGYIATKHTIPSVLLPCYCRYLALRKMIATIIRCLSLTCPSSFRAIEFTVVALKTIGEKEQTNCRMLVRTQGKKSELHLSSSPVPSSSTRVRMLGVDQDLPWIAQSTGMVIAVPPLTPDIIPCRYAWVFSLSDLENLNDRSEQSSMK
jgi:Alpha-L-fucosidase C-terminal domain